MNVLIFSELKMKAYYPIFFNRIIGRLFKKFDYLEFFSFDQSVSSDLWFTWKLINIGTFGNYVLSWYSANNNQMAGPAMKFNKTGSYGRGVYLRQS